MRPRLRTFKALGKNKYEFYASLLIVGFLMQARLSPDLSNYLIFAGMLVIGFFCSLNALLDFRNMNLFERVLAVLWFFTLLYLTLVTIWCLAFGTHAPPIGHIIRENR